MMFLATWYVFAVTPENTPVSNDDTEYCERGFYTAVTAFISTDLGLAVLLVLYLSILAVFYVYYRDYLSIPRGQAKPNTRRANVNRSF